MGAIILAGGKSRRMGRDKATLPYKTSSLLEQVIHTVREVTSDILVVGSASSQHTLSIGHYVPDRYPGEGPLGGLITGLAEMGEGWHWALACDMPLLKIEVLRALESAIQEGVMAVIPEIEGRLEPLCALYHHLALPLLNMEFENGQRALHRAVRKLNMILLSEAELRNLDPTLESLNNINTPEEFLALSSKQEPEGA